MIRTRGVEVDAGRARKRPRTVQISSLPPLFITTSHHVTSRHQPQRITVAGSTEPSSTSAPKMASKRNSFILGRNPVQVRSSSPAPLPPSGSKVIGKQLELFRPTSLSDGGQLEAHRDSRGANRSLLQQHRQLHRNDPSSPIGTFGGQFIGRSDLGLGPSHLGCLDSPSGALRPEAVKRQTLDLPVQLQTYLRTRTQRRKSAQGTTAKSNENTDALLAPETRQRKRTTTKRPAQGNLVKPKKRRPKIQRIQLGRTLPTSSAEQPLSDAGHQLNSQPDEAECLDVADESGISYFPTLPRARLDSGNLPNTTTDVSLLVATTSNSRNAEQSISLLDRSLLSTTTPAASTAMSQSGQEDDSGQLHDDSLASETGSSVGLFEVLSQSAMRRLDHVQSSNADPAQRSHQINPPHVTVQSSQTTEEQPQVYVDFDPCRFTRAQAQRNATSILKSRVEQSWNPVHPDNVSKQWQRPMHPSFKARAPLQAALRPPSKRAVCRDLGLDLTQLLRGPAVELCDFFHFTRTDRVSYTQPHDHEELEPFEHDLHFAGYRLSNAKRTIDAAHDGKRDKSIPYLQAFNTAELCGRMKSRRKEVVKLIVPFSEPSLSPHATCARFVQPQQDYSVSACLRNPATLRSNNDVLLVWMQSTAQNFVHALQVMLQSDSTASAQIAPYGIESPELDLYPSPILHYAPHAGLTASVPKPATKVDSATRNVMDECTLSHVALYVHLDRIREARCKLAALELSDTQSGADSYRPFGDPLVRLLVTSLKGEPLCLI